jgi:hypothetical protein
MQACYHETGLCMSGISRTGELMEHLEEVETVEEIAVERRGWLGKPYLNCQ